MNGLLEKAGRLVRWIGKDGMLHICIPALSMLLCSWISPKWVTACVLLAGALVGEAVAVQKRQSAERFRHDLACDWSGVVLGFIISIVLTGM